MLARKGGKGVALASMPHDPLLSTARKPFFSFGHVWVVLALWVPLPMGGARGFAVPVLFRLYVGAKRGGQRDAPSRATTGVRLRAAQAAHPPASQRPTKLELARELIGLVATWAGDRTLYAVVDSAYAGQELLRDRPPTVHVISRLRLDAALWTRPRRRSPPARAPGAEEAGAGARALGLGRPLGRQPDALRGRRQRLRRPGAPARSPADRPRHQPPALGRRAVDPTPPAQPRSDRPPPQA